MTIRRAAVTHDGRGRAGGREGGADARTGGASLPRPPLWALHHENGRPIQEGDSANTHTLTVFRNK